MTATWTPPAPGSSAAGQALARASQPDYGDWLDHVRAAGGCTRPIRLTGDLYTIQRQGGRSAILDHRHTDQLPDAAIYKACGTRLASVCPSCARTYQRDAFQILRSFLVGGKGIPTTVARHPGVFATFTAPSFGTVHTRNVRDHSCINRKRCDCRPDPCHARRDHGLCEHGNPAVCWARHAADDPVLGRPLCLDCYDHEHHVVWNLFSTELWHRTKQAADRYLAQLCKTRGLPPVAKVTAGGNVRMVAPAQLTHGKAAEMQRRAVVHFHALIRLDGVHPTDPDAVLAPPAGVDADDITAALRHAVETISFTTPPHPDRPGGWPIRWGDPDKGFDVQTLLLAGDGSITDELIAEQAARKAGYLAKYTTKSTEATGFSSTRLDGDTIGLFADPDGDHIARLLAACWHLGHDPDHQPAARTGLLRASTGPAGGPFIAPWDSPDCGGHTRYRVCPRCAAERQASLDTKPANTGTATNPYARLRRWAHRFGFAGHFLTKTRRRVVRFATLRDTRINYRRTEQADTGTIRAVDHLDEETTLIVGALSFAGVGWHNNGDAMLANTAAAMARERQEIGREELAHEIGTALEVNVQTAA
jgi:hypothetical protein